MASIRVGIVSAALALVPAIAVAQVKLDARYVVTLAGVPIGKGAWIVNIGDDQYTAAASGATTGLLRFVRCRAVPVKSAGRWSTGVWSRLAYESASPRTRSPTKFALR